MAMRLHEIHPSMTHFPVALLPAAVGIEIAARITEDDNLEKLGRVAMATASATSLLTTATGLVAEQEVKGGERARSMLLTHKYLNIATGALTTAMTVYRFTGRRPGWAYLSAGVSSLGVLVYSAYLGGQMVYDEGMGVERADGLRLDEAPRLRPGNFKNVVFTLGRQLKRGVAGLFQDLTLRPADFLDAEEFEESLRRDNEQPGALPIGPTNRP